MNATTFCQLCKDINQRVPGLLPDFIESAGGNCVTHRTVYNPIPLATAADLVLGRYYVWKANIDGTLHDDIWDNIREATDPIENFAEDNLRERLKRAKEQP